MYGRRFGRCQQGHHAAKIDRGTVSDEDHPLEPFKRATVATMRAIAENDELEVTFGKGAATVRGQSVEVPLPTVGCSEQELNAIRGMGDEVALKLRYHDTVAHRTRTPKAGPAQELFESVSYTHLRAHET